MQRYTAPAPSPRAEAGNQREQPASSPMAGTPDEGRAAAESSDALGLHSLARPPREGGRGMGS